MQCSAIQNIGVSVIFENIAKSYLKIELDIEEEDEPKDIETNISKVKDVPDKNKTKDEPKGCCDDCSVF